MMIRKVACPLDCFDVCEAEVHIDNGKIVKIQGSKDNPLTAGFICKKGRSNIERLSRPDRITKPLLKKEGAFVPITMDEALDLIAEKIRKTIEKSRDKNKDKSQRNGKALVHLYDCGYGGISKSVDQLFFNLLGGASTITGGLCWSAGNAATKLDFGDVLGHRFDDCHHSKMVILWSRNPAKSNVHFFKQLLEAQKKGTRIIVIDPVLTETAKMADLHIRLRPSSDAALALGMAKWILENHHKNQPEWEEQLATMSHGFGDFKSLVQQQDMDQLAAVCGIERQIIENLAKDYVEASPASIYMGYGLQRYVHGGNSVRLINALAMISGHMGIQGGGVTYANRRIRRYLDFDRANQSDLVKNQRLFINGEFGQFLQEATNPEVGFVWIDKANPVNQCPDGNAILKGLHKADFVVTVDLFMTDTAAASDLILPATGLLEEDDFCYSSMMAPYLLYTEKALELPEDMMEEFEIYKSLAERLGVAFPFEDKTAYLKAVLKPLMDTFGKSYEELKNHRFELPENPVPWNNGVFATTDGRYRFVTTKELGPLMGAISADFNLADDSEDACITYPLRLLTVHSGDSLNSQGYLGVTKRAEVHLNESTAMKYGLSNDDAVRVTTRVGSIVATLRVSEDAGDDFLLMYQGWWRISGSANALTEQLTTDIGGQAAYYDTYCRLDKVE